MKEYIDNFTLCDHSTFYSILKTSMVKNKKTFIVTANPESIMNSRKDNKIKIILKNREYIIVPDSISIAFALRMNGKKAKPIAGVDIAKKLIEDCAKLNKKIYFFGSEQKVLNMLRDRLKKDYPSINIVGSIDGYNYNEEEVVNDIIKKKPDVILVALGIPKQELFIERHYKDFERGIFIGVGGSLDVLSGYKKRAPKIFIKLRLEWLYRILKEPKRIKRFINNNIRFLFNIYK